MTKWLRNTTFTLIAPLQRIVCLLLLLLFVATPTHAGPSQKSDADSIALRQKFDIALRELNTDSAIRLLKTTLKEGTHARMNWAISGCLFKLGEKYALNGEWQNSLNYIKQAQPYCTTIAETCNYYSHLGWIYYDMGDYVSASENFYAALDCLKKDGVGTPSESAIYRFLGMINFLLHQNEKALYYFDQSIAVALKYDQHKNYIVLALIAKGEFYTNLHQPDSAIKCYNEALGIARRIERPDLAAEANEGLGKAFIESGAYEKAVHYLQEAVGISETRDKERTADASFYLGDALYRLKRYSEAESILVPALKLATTAQLKPNAVTGYAILAEVYKARGQYARALDCMDSVVALKDSLVGAEKVKAINVMDIKYKSAEKDKKIAQQNNKIARKNMWIVGIAACIIILLLLLAWIRVNTLNQQRSLEKENKISILNAAILGGDSERGRIARELHDGIGGMLSAAMMRFSSMQRDNAAIAVTPAYNDAMSILREMGDEIRKTAHNLMPEVLLKQSLPEAVQAYCNSVWKEGVLEMDFQCYGTFGDLNEQYKLNLYRIVQELVKNVVEHARATSAIVQLMRTDDVLILSVEDNGTGFNMDERKGGQGLHNMQTRIKNLDGKFTLGSIPGKGTSVFIEMKIPGS